MSLFLKDTYWNIRIKVSCLQWTLKWFRKRKKERTGEIWKKEKEKKYTVYRGRGKREGEGDRKCVTFGESWWRVYGHSFYCSFNFSEGLKLYKIICCWIKNMALGLDL